MFLDFYAVSRGIASASHMFVSRGLPTCNMLIRKSIYAFMTSTKRSCNTILQNIVGSDHIYTSPLRQHWRRMMYMHGITNQRNAPNRHESAVFAQHTSFFHACVRLRMVRLCEVPNFRSIFQS